MIMRVATFSTNQRMLTAALQTQARMANLQIQQASGITAFDYGGIGADTRQLISLEVTLTRSQSHEAATKSANAHVETMYSTLSSLSDLLTSFRTKLVALKSTDISDIERASMQKTAETNLEELAALLNTRYGSQYLFSGGATSTAPVDLSSYSVTDATTADTSYYQGGNNKAAVMVSESHNITYGINADNSAFEKAFRSLGLIADATAPLDEATIDDALDLIIEAIEGTAAVQGQLSVNAVALERALVAQQDLQSYLETGISSIKDVDVAALTAKLTTYETQLQASFAALAKVQSLNLLDYVR